MQHILGAIGFAFLAAFLPYTVDSYATISVTQRAVIGAALACAWFGGWMFGARP